MVTDGSGPRTITYQVPPTCRASAVAGAEGGLIGTAEHEYSGAGGSATEPAIRFWVALLVALAHGTTEPQAQSVRDTPDPTVIARLVANGCGGSGATAAGEAGQPCLSATWRLTDGTQVRGISATREVPARASGGRKDERRHTS
jgi:hypothetical protein